MLLALRVPAPFPARPPSLTWRLAQRRAHGGRGRTPLDRSCRCSIEARGVRTRTAFPFSGGADSDYSDRHSTSLVGAAQSLGPVTSAISSATDVRDRRA